MGGDSLGRMHTKCSTIRWSGTQHHATSSAPAMAHPPDLVYAGGGGSAERSRGSIRKAQCSVVPHTHLGLTSLLPCRAAAAAAAEGTLLRRGSCTSDRGLLARATSQASASVSGASGSGCSATCSRQHGRAARRGQASCCSAGLHEKAAAAATRGVRAAA